MDLRGEATTLSVQEAMKILNMTKFTAEELNEKFRYRVQSITRGLGGSLEYQKSIYTAWEYLNRMLARETSNQTEEVLKKVDKTVTILEKPKQLDMIPVRLNKSKKASLIIQKESDLDERKLRNLKTKVNKTTEKDKLHNLEKSLGVSALPGQLLQKHIKWIEQETNSKPQKTDFKVERICQDQKAEPKKRLARLNNTIQKIPKKDLTTLQLKEIITIDRSERSSKEDKGDVEKQQLGKILEKLPKLPRTQSQALLFKRTALNQMFETPRKPSKSDQRASAQRAVWKEKANQILSESTNRPKTGAKIKPRKTTRRSVSKQPVEQMLYRSLNMADETYSDTKHQTLPARPKNCPRFSEATRLPNNKLAQGPFTPSRIMKWIKSAQEGEAD